MISRQRPMLLEISNDLGPLIEQLETLLLGGKRLRPLFGYCGLKVAGGTWGVAEAKALASLEFLQACALIHDDVMDDSKTRRGNLAVHEFFKAQHESKSLAGDSYLYGIGSAILLGDLCLSWADEMLMEATNYSSDVKSLWDITRSELMAGQYLDLLAQSSNTNLESQLDTVMTFKSAKYTIERPLHIGAALVGRNTGREVALSAYAIPLGKAFQLRDDVLGVFGDESVTGKPAGGDLREGKRTMLIAFAESNASENDKIVLNRVLGNKMANEMDLAQAKDILAKISLPHIEERINELGQEAQSAVDTLHADADTKSLMRELITLAISRKL
jgi:geranylgeranyl diphosphate synthase type I